ncbi:uncharacterized protein CEXT_726331 [Caerostris extrusa]|uniref:Uncharacterized protein n=1 Tax=Caerostris extrusa TaxID=172846 RepID=A0AAV4PYU8_CAEEX|nr:uncharacterized protein CEXT_726331 [Caerostris extrusa]
MLLFATWTTESAPPASPFHIDYENCVTVNSEARDGGSVDKWRPWRVQCPTAGPQVAVSLHRRRRIHTGLKCCVLKGTHHRMKCTVWMKTCFKATNSKFEIYGVSINY